MSTNYLIQLIYVSRNLIAGTHDDIVASVEQILTTSRAHNAATSITGALMFNDGCFAQVLEGPEEAVYATFERISADPRHRSVIMIAEQPIEHRRFPGWDMAFVGCSTAASERFAEVLNDSSFNPDLLTGDWVFDVIIEHLYGAEGANDPAVTV